MTKKLCYFTNLPSHYREEICLKIQQEFEADIYFGSKSFAKIKEMSFNEFDPKPTILQTTIIAGKVTWVHGLINLLIGKNYKYYLFLGEIHSLSTWLSLLLAKILSKKIFLWSHGVYGRESKFMLFIKSLFFNLSSGVFVYSNYSRNLMIKSGIPENKLHTIYNSLNNNKIKDARLMLHKNNTYIEHFKNDYPVLIYIGRIQKQKKLELLIEALDICRTKNNLLLNLVIIGDGDHKSKLLKIVEDSECKNNIWLYGSCYEEKTIGNLMMNADICVSPGEVGLTAIHSMIYGTPVITHNKFTGQGPEFEAIKRGETGEFFIENNPISLASTIHSWINRYPEKTSDLALKCINRTEKFYNPDSQITILKNVLV